MGKRRWTFAGSVIDEPWIEISLDGLVVRADLRTSLQ